MKMSAWSLGCQQSVFQRYHSEKLLYEFYPQDGGESLLALQLRHGHPMYSNQLANELVLIIGTRHRCCVWSNSRKRVDTRHTHTYTHTRLTALCPGLPGWAATRNVKPIWILLKQETMNGSGISWAICKSAHRSRQITTPAPHHSVIYRPDAIPTAQPTASKHWRHNV